LGREDERRDPRYVSSLTVALCCRVLTCGHFTGQARAIFAGDCPPGFVFDVIHAHNTATGGLGEQVTSCDTHLILYNPGYKQGEWELLASGYSRGTVASGLKTLLEVLRRRMGQKLLAQKLRKLRIQYVQMRMLTDLLYCSSRGFVREAPTTSTTRSLAVPHLYSYAQHQLRTRKLRV